jgi:hypothetical protein
VLVDPVVHDVLQKIEILLHLAHLFLVLVYVNAKCAHPVH